MLSISTRDATCVPSMRLIDGHEPFKPSLIDQASTSFIITFLISIGTLVWSLKLRTTTMLMPVTSVVASAASSDSNSITCHCSMLTSRLHSSDLHNMTFRGLVWWTRSDMLSTTAHRSPLSRPVVPLCQVATAACSSDDSILLLSYNPLDAVRSQIWSVLNNDREACFFVINFDLIKFDLTVLDFWCGAAIQASTIFSHRGIPRDSRRASNCLHLCHV